MFCPICKAEYRPGFTRCPDCDVDLIESLGSITSSAAAEDGPESPSLLWTGTDAAALSALSAALDAANITYHERDRSPGTLPGMWDSVYAVFVHARDREKAQAVLDDVRQHFEIDEPVDEPVNEPVEDSGDAELPRESSALPDEGEGVESAPDDIAPDFSPEDATAEVWAGDDAEMAETVRVCLRENGIGCVVDESGGKRCVRVLPASAARAREIIREVVEGTPPE